MAPFRCGCRPGFRLLDGLVSCASRNPCSSSPCGGEATCFPGPSEQTSCHCPPGYQLDSTQRDCVDVDECQDSPCAQDCVNTPRGASAVSAGWALSLVAPKRGPAWMWMSVPSHPRQTAPTPRAPSIAPARRAHELAGEDGTQCLGRGRV